MGSAGYFRRPFSGGSPVSKHGVTSRTAQLENLPLEGKSSEFGGYVNYRAGSPEWSHKNEKDWPPIHSGEQSLQIILLNERD
jgi:hypothetical protein